MCDALWYTDCMTQLVARIPNEVLSEIDRLVDAGAFESRSDAVREALVQLIDRHRRAGIGRQIVEGYMRVPQSDEELLWTDEDTKAMIEDEPW